VGILSSLEVNRNSDYAEKASGADRIGTALATLTLISCYLFCRAHCTL
jgi:hypothetical protein